LVPAEAAGIEAVMLVDTGHGEDRAVSGELVPDRVDCLQRGKVDLLLVEGPDIPLGSALTEEIAIRAAATSAGASSAWLAARVTGSPVRARTVGLVTLIGTQLGQTLLVGGRSPAVACRAWPASARSSWSCKHQESASSSGASRSARSAGPSLLSARSRPAQAR
jgi:hypothetical protein